MGCSGREVIGTRRRDVLGVTTSIEIGAGTTIRKGDRIAWAGHDGSNKSCGIRYGRVEEIRDNGDLLVLVHYTSNNRQGERRHVIKSSELKKAVRAW